MSAPSLTLLILFVIFIAAFTRSAIGFGDALLAMPLLVFWVGLEIATPLVALTALITSISILLGSWQEIDFRSAWRLVLSSVAGIPLGIFLLKIAPESIVKAVLGVILIAFGLYNIFTPRLNRLSNQVWAYFFGFIAGVLGGAYNTIGPPIVIYGKLRGWSPTAFRATLQGYFLITGLSILASHALAGFWTAEVMRLFAFSIPVVVLAVYFGGLLNKKLTGTQFNNVIYISLIIMGVLLFL